MNELEATQTITALAANWPQLRDLDPIALELWFRNAFRHTPAPGNATDTKPDALEVIDALVSTMTYAPKPADWVRVENELRTERRRRTQYALTEHTEEMPAAERQANLARLRSMIEQSRLRKTLEEQ